MQFVFLLMNFLTRPTLEEYTRTTQELRAELVLQAEREQQALHEVDKLRKFIGLYKLTLRRHSIYTLLGFFVSDAEIKNLRHEVLDVATERDGLRVELSKLRIALDNQQR